MMVIIGEMRQEASGDLVGAGENPLRFSFDLP
jgi:hypothetical protein